VVHNSSWRATASSVAEEANIDNENASILYHSIALARYGVDVPVILERPSSAFYQPFQDAAAKSSLSSPSGTPPDYGTVAQVQDTVKRYRHDTIRRRRPANFFLVCICGSLCVLLLGMLIFLLLLAFLFPCNRNSVACPWPR
jgi:hypothetical protein